MMRIGVGIQDYYCICAVIGLYKKTCNVPAGASTLEYQAAERVTKRLQKMLSLQDNFSAAATLASLPNMVCFVSSLQFSAQSNKPSLARQLYEWHQRYERPKCKRK